MRALAARGVRVRRGVALAAAASVVRFPWSAGAHGGDKITAEDAGALDSTVVLVRLPRAALAASMRRLAWLLSPSKHLAKPRG